MPVNPCVTKGCGRYELEAENARLREELAESIMAEQRRKERNEPSFCGHGRRDR